MLGRIVAGWRSDTDIQILQEKDIVDGGEVLPGFQMAVAAMFEG